MLVEERRCGTRLGRVLGGVGVVGSASILSRSLSVRGKQDRGGSDGYKAKVLTRISE